MGFAPEARNAYILARKEKILSSNLEGDRRERGLGPLLRIPRAIKVLIVCLGILTCCIGNAATPSIWFTSLPSTNGATSATVAGKVAGVPAEAYGVQVLWFSPDQGWVHAPNCQSPLTRIEADSSWKAALLNMPQTGSMTRVAAILLPTNAPMPCINGQKHLSGAISNATDLTVVTVARPGARWIRFSGLDWWVKRSAGKAGPGPNYFSDSTNNVWVDASGKLHLRVTYSSNTWQCAEVVSARSFGLGSYRFQIHGDVDRVDRNLVLGLFTWSDDPAFAHREIDFEAARWGNAGDIRNSQYVVQPYELPGHLTRLTVPRGVTNATHVFTWETNKVVFKSQRGEYEANPPASNILSGWTYTQAVPQPGDENVRLNLWLNGGLPPSNGQQEEVIISSFVYSPPGQPMPPVIEIVRWEADSVYFRCATEPDRRYLLQSTADLVQWTDENVLTAAYSSLQWSIPGRNALRFFRVVALP